MKKKLKQIVWIAMFISILCHAACLDPTANSFDKSGSSYKPLVINEVVARAVDGGNDWIELYNAGENDLYLRDYALVDDNLERESASLPDIILESGEFILIQATDEEPEDGSFYVPFRLGTDDRIILYWGLTIIDVLDWELNEAPAGYSYGRFPDGIGEACTLIPTPNAINQEIFKSPLVINEIVARPADGDNDWIELYNSGEEIVYLEDYTIVDDNPAYGLAELPDMTLEPGEFFVIQATSVAPGDGSFYVPFGLGVDDSVTLYRDSDIMDVLDWEDGDAPEGYSFGRLPDGSEMVQTLVPTPGQPNDVVELFPKDQVIEVRLELANEAWEAILADPMAEEYHRGSITYKDFHVDGVLRYLAVSTALTNLDSYQGPFAQNYYLYEENGVFSIIPWDLNMSFGAFTMGCDRTDIIEFMIDEPTTGKLEDRPLIARLLENPDYLAIYHDYLEELITGPFSPEVIVPIIDETADLIRIHVYADPTKFFTAEEFEQALDSDLIRDPNATGMNYSTIIGLKTFVYERAASIREQLDGFAPSCGDGSGNCSDGSLPEPGELSFEDAIAEVSPSYAVQGDMNVIVTITLSEQEVMPPDINPSHVKIGTIEGAAISQNGLEISAIFDIPMDETPGLKDVSIRYEPPDGLSPPGGFPPSGGFPPIGGSPPPGGFLPPGGFPPPSDFPFPSEDGLVFMKPGAFEVLTVY